MGKENQFSQENHEHQSWLSLNIITTIIIITTVMKFKLIGSKSGSNYDDIDRNNKNDNK